MSKILENNNSKSGKPVRRDMSDFYLKKLECCDRRIAQLEQQVKEMELAEQKVKQMTLSQTAMNTSSRGDKGVPISPTKKISKEQETKLVQRLTFTKERDIESMFPPIENKHPARSMWERLRPGFEGDSDHDEFDVDTMVERLGVQDVDLRAEHAAHRLEEVEENGVNSMWKESVRQISIARRRRVEGDDVDEDEDDEELYTLSEERMEALGSRLCKESLEHKKQLLHELEEKYYGPHVNKSFDIERSRMKRQADGGEHDRAPSPQEIGQRLHDAAVAKKKAALAALQAKYLDDSNCIRDKNGNLKVIPKLTKERANELAERLSSKKNN